MSFLLPHWSTNPAYRDMVRSLLIPGMYRINDRGFPWTEEELQAVIDAYFSKRDPAKACSAAKNKIEEFRAMPMAVLAQQRGLACLKSVSAAYRRSHIPQQLRKGYPDAHWKSIAKTYRRAGQAAGGAGSGGAEAFDRLFKPAPRSAAENLLIAANSPGLLKGANNYSGPGLMMLPPGMDPRRVMVMPPGGSVVVHSATVQPLRVSGGTGSPTPPAPPLPRSIKAGEIKAWRCWQVNREEAGYRLRSTSMSTAWPTNKPIKMSPEIMPTYDYVDGNDGRIKTKPEPAYFFDYGSHGIHAFKDRWRAVEYLRTIGPKNSGAIGQVEMWGEVIEHRIGYRAEYAQICSIDYCTGGETVRAELCRDYGIPFIRKGWGGWFPYSPWAGPFAMMAFCINLIENMFFD